MLFKIGSYAMRDWRKESKTSSFYNNIVYDIETFIVQNLTSLAETLIDNWNIP